MQEDDGEPFEEKMKRLTSKLALELEQGRALEETIKQSLVKLGFALPEKHDGGGEEG